MTAIPYIWWFTFPHEQAADGCADDVVGEGVDVAVGYMGEGEWMLEAASDPLLPEAARDPARFDAFAYKHGALTHGGKWFDLVSDVFVIEGAE